MAQRTWPMLHPVLESSTGSQNFIDEWAAVHLFVGWKMAQAWGFWPSVALHAFYELVVDPWRHAPEDVAAPINTAGDLLAGVVGAYLGAQYRRT